jgi:glycosyltransferase involved in cell wall biosynthesis
VGREGVRVRILTVVTEGPPVLSGIATVVERLGSGLRRLGHEVDTLTCAQVGRCAFGEVRLTGLVAHWPQVRRRLDTYDVVHLHGPAPTFSDAFLALYRTIPARSRPGLVYTHHSEIEFAGLTPICAAYNRLHRHLTNAASHVVVSTESYRLLVGHGFPRHVDVIPFGVDAMTPGAERERGRMVVLFIGQLRPYKGVDVLVRAAAELPDVVVHIAGTGHQEARLLELARRLGASNVTFHGAVSDARRDALMRTADVVVLPSRTRAEAFGLALLEGMRAGAVPVASDLPGLRDVAGEAGLLIEPGGVRSLVQALCHLRDDPGDRRRRRLASMAVAAGYSWEATARAYHRVLADAALVHWLREAPPWNLGRALSLMREAALAERASLLLLNPARERLQVIGVSGRPLPETAQNTGVGMDSFAARALRASEPYIVGDTTSSLGHPRQREAHAELCVPFQLEGRVHGVVNFTRLRALDFLPQEVSWMSKRVGHVAARLLSVPARGATERVAVEAIA